MQTIIRKVDENCIDEKIMKEAGALLKAGALVAFPTETVYGLGANALDEKAAAKIYAAKGRPSDNPLIVHIADMESLKLITEEIPEAAYQLADKFWPGPLTMVLKKSDAVPYGTTGGLDTVAVRMPSHPIALEMIRYGGGYIAAPSANTSGRPSPTLASHVLDDMNGIIPMILDGGAVGIGIESTIVDLTEGVPTILRPGFITKEMLEEVVGEVQIDKGLSADSKTPPKAPGMKYRHYAPKADLMIVEGAREAVIEKINALVQENESKGVCTGIIGTEETISRYPSGIVKSMGTRRDELSISSHLYSILREFDESDAEIIYSESFSEGAMGSAIMNRLLKAAGHKIMKV
ncbi:MAG: L-threonylcarbamoyladenylate synthase [Lachnospiraceae bacterium]|nr:threonylcarbamoyl-AMP synthase [Lachnospiraceae bacterium]MEE1015196.1 L-threonylcarbamoyladenylate synthase [Lachnospiraceae bacterium]